VQVTAADAVLRENPFGDERLFSEIEPSAAAVAAEHWLAAAAEVTAEAAGLDYTLVLIEADNIESA